MRTILYYETGSGFGGSTQSLYQLVRSVDRRRVHPIVVALNESAAIQKIRELETPVYVLRGVTKRTCCVKKMRSSEFGVRSNSAQFGYCHLMMRWMCEELPQMLRLIRLMRRERVDVVHLNNDLYSTVAGLLAARFLKKPIVCHLRLTRAPTRLERCAGRWIDVKIALTEEARAFYRRFWPNDRIVRIPNGVEIPVYSPRTEENAECVKPIPNSARLRGELGIPQEKRVVCLIARCVPGKGYEEFLSAAKIVIEKRTDAAFVIVGNGHGGDVAYEARMHKFAESLQLNGAVIFAGWQQDARRVYEAVDIIVQASSTFPEGLSRVVLEAMAHARPVIATDIAGNREAVVHEKTGLLVPPADAQLLADAIITLLDDPAGTRQYGLAARRRAEERFSIASHAQRIQLVYDELLSKGCETEDKG